jgi:hypothetical protein
MKSLLVLLLVANGVVAGWTVLLPAAPVSNVASPLPPLDAARLVLVSERHEIVEIREPAAPRAGDVAITAAIPATFARECRAWGPFSARDAADARLQALAADGVAADLATERVAAKQLVYVDRPAGASAASVCAALGSEGVDCQPIVAGERAGALSVGVFRNPALAQAQAARVSGLGYAAHVVSWGSGAPVFNVVAWVDPSEIATGEASEACVAIAPPERFL